MTDPRITNCHIHTFTTDHVPKYYPHWTLFIFKRIPGLVRALAAIAHLIGWDRKADTLDRLYQFQNEAAKTGQSDILDAVRRYYPGDTRFVVLPMDMALIGHGPVRADIAAQHDELAKMAKDARYKGRVLPFATVHPGREGGAQEVRRAINDLDFRGLKLYPRLGFRPDHPVLMQEVYPFLEEKGLPVMSHCSRGGVQGRGLSPEEADAYTDPAAFEPVMEAFPKLRICLAHFGGQRDWKTYVDEGLDPEDAQVRAANWQVKIRDMITSGKWPGLWTDISYTLFHFDDNIPFLRLFLRGEGERAKSLQRRVLFGSDFYMTRREALSERAVCFRLRNALGEELFRRIAQVNPEIWLGEVPEDNG